MRKFIGLFVFLLAFFPFGANSGLKIDGLAIVERFTVFGTTVGDAAGVVTDTAAATKEIIQRGTQVKAYLEKTKLLVDDVRAKLDAIKPGYEGEDDKTYEEEEAEAQEKLAGTEKQLEREDENLEFDIEARKEALATEYAGKKLTAEENLKILNQMLNDAEDEQTRATIQAEIYQTQGIVQEYEESIADLQSQDSQILNNDEKYQKLAEQKEQVKQKLKSYALLAAGTLATKLFSASSIQGMLKKDDETKTQEYNAVIQANFLMPEEAEISENVDKKRKHRSQELINSMAEAFVAGVKFRNKFDKTNEDLHRIQDNMEAADQQVAALGMQTQQTIQETEVLHEYNKLLIVDMKLRTALNMLNQDYRLKNYDKDPASLNLDNYVFTEEDMNSDEKKKSFLDGVRAK